MSGRNNFSLTISYICVSVCVCGGFACVTCYSLYSVAFECFYMNSEQLENKTTLEESETGES